MATAVQDRAQIEAGVFDSALLVFGEGHRGTTPAGVRRVELAGQTARTGLPEARRRAFTASSSDWAALSTAASASRRKVRNSAVLMGFVLAGVQVQVLAGEGPLAAAGASQS